MQMLSIFTRFALCVSLALVVEVFKTCCSTERWWRYNSIKECKFVTTTITERGEGCFACYKLLGTLFTKQSLSVREDQRQPTTTSHSPCPCFVNRPCFVLVWFFVEFVWPLRGVSTAVERVGKETNGSRAKLRSRLFFGKQLQLPWHWKKTVTSDGHVTHIISSFQFWDLLQRSSFSILHTALLKEGQQ